MIAEFDEDGVRFRYPADWTVERQEDESSWTVVLQSPDTAFWMLTLDAGLPTLEHVTETALAALRDDYPDLEADECIDSMAGQPALGHDIRFFSFDLTNTCRTRSFYSGRGTVFVLYQFNDLELEKHGPILQAISASLAVDDD